MTKSRSKNTIYSKNRLFGNLNNDRFNETISDQEIDRTIDAHSTQNELRTQLKQELDILFANMKKNQNQSLTHEY